MDVFDLFRSERDKWKTRIDRANLNAYPGLPQFDARSRDLFERALPRDILIPRLQRDRDRRNYWMSPHELRRHGYVPGQIILGKLAGRFIGHMDDRPMATIAKARSGKNIDGAGAKPLSLSRLDVGA